MSVQTVVEHKQLAFNKMVDFWVGKSSNGDDDKYVGREGENHTFQQKKIEDILRTRFSPDTFFKTALDFGSGWGRFEPFLDDFCGHIWAADLIEKLVQRAAARSPVVTPHKISYPVHFPLKRPKFDLLWACLVFQHITDDSILDATLTEIRRVLKPGARVLILDNARDKAYHVAPRDPGVFARLLSLKPGYRADLVTINNRPQDHWFIDGVVTE